MAHHWDSQARGALREAQDDLPLQVVIVDVLKVGIVCFGDHATSRMRGASRCAACTRWHGGPVCARNDWLTQAWGVSFVVVGGPVPVRWYVSCLRGSPKTHSGTQITDSTVSSCSRRRSGPACRYAFNCVPLSLPLSVSPSLPLSLSGGRAAHVENGWAWSLVLCAAILCSPCPLVGDASACPMKTATPANAK